MKPKQDAVGKFAVTHGLGVGKIVKVTRKKFVVMVFGREVAWHERDIAGIHARREAAEAAIDAYTKAMAANPSKLAELREARTKAAKAFFSAERQLRSDAVKLLLGEMADGAPTEG